MINDPMSQMAQAQKLTIPQLQQALRNGTIDPQVGQIVLASKIKQSKDAKMAMAAQQPAQPPVAQQNLAYGQGVDTLPSNLPVQGMAAGGIIAFDEGGEVIRAANGLPPAAFQGYQFDPNQDWNANYREAAQTHIDERLAEQYPDMPKQLAQYKGPTPFDAALNYYKNPALKSNALGTSGIPDSARQSAISNLEQQRNAWIAGHKNPFTKESPLGAKTNTAVIPTAAAPADVPAKKEAPVATPAGSDKSLDDYFKSMDSGSASASTKTKGSAGIASPYEIKKYDDSELKGILASEMNPATGKPWTYEEKAAVNRKQGEAAGIDYDVYKSQREELDKLKAKSAERSKLDSAMPWFAASKAFGEAKAGEGLGTTAGRVLGAYGTSATEIDEKELARQEKIRTEGNALALAQNAFNQAQYAGNKSDLKEAQSAVKSARTNLANLGIKQVDQQNEVAKTVYETQAKERMNAASVGATMYAADKAQHTVVGIAKAIQADNPGMSNSDALKRAYEISNPGFAAIAGRDVTSQRAAINAQIVKLQGTPAYSTADKAEKTRQLGILQQQLNAIGTGTGVADTSGTAGANTVDFSKLPK